MRAGRNIVDGLHKAGVIYPIYAAMAAVIDRDTNLPELLAVCRRLAEVAGVIRDGHDKGYPIPVGVWLRLSQAVEDVHSATAAAEKR